MMVKRAQAMMTADRTMVSYKISTINSAPDLDRCARAAHKMDASEAAGRGMPFLAH